MKVTDNKIGAGSGGKDPLQMCNLKGTIYRFGESSTEADLARVDEVPKDHPFARIEDSELTRQ
jgi:hypothetical protein